MMQPKPAPAETEAEVPAEEPAAGEKDINDTEIAETETPLPAPTWFSSKYIPDRPAQLAERYRQTPLAPVQSYGSENDAFEEHYRNMTGWEPPPARSKPQRAWNPPPPGRMAPIPPRPMLPKRHIIGQDAYYGNRRRPAPADDGEHRSFLANLSLGKSFMLASCVAILAGAGAGFAITRIDDLPTGQEVKAMLTGNLWSTQSTSKAPAADSKTAVSQPAAPVSTPLTPKPVTIATLDVNDVTGSLNSNIPLLLHAEPGSESQPIALKIMGLPETAYLTAGTRIEGNAWLLSPGEEAGVNLVVPKAEQPSFDVSVAAIETKTGELAAPIKEMNVALDDPDLNVVPASAPPIDQRNVKSDIAEGQTVKQAPAEPETMAPVLASIATPASTDLIRKGELLLQSGDIAGARQFFERAYASGSAEGALGAARTFDPVVYAELNVQGLKPDPDKALEWYKKAQLSGSREAAIEIQRLEGSASVP
jgi:hypothetical protein